MHAVSSYRGIRPINKQTNTQKHKHTHTHKQTGPITIHCAAKLSAKCKYGMFLLAEEKKRAPIILLIAIFVICKVS